MKAQSVDKSPRRRTRRISSSIVSSGNNKNATSQRRNSENDQDSYQSPKAGFVRGVVTKGRTRPHLTKEQKRKTELCRNIREKGRCQYADRCLFAHSDDELRLRPTNPKFRRDLCKAFHEEGFCGYGPRCSFRHEVRTEAELAEELDAMVAEFQKLRLAKGKGLQALQRTNGLLFAEKGFRLYDENQDHLSVRDIPMYDQHKLSIDKSKFLDKYFPQVCQESDFMDSSLPAFDHSGHLAAGDQRFESVWDAFEPMSLAKDSAMDTSIWSSTNQFQAQEQESRKPIENPYEVTEKIRISESVVLFRPNDIESRAA